ITNKVIFSIHVTISLLKHIENLTLHSSPTRRSSDLTFWLPCLSLPASWINWLWPNGFRSCHYVSLPPPWEWPALQHLFLLTAIPVTRSRGLLKPNLATAPV